MRPTEAPVLASDTARFTATVLLPTPPLPEATTMTFFTPGISSCGSGCFTSREVRFTVTSALRSTYSWMAATQSSLIFFFIGHAGVVSTRSKETFCPSTLMFSIIPSSVRLRPKSGSSTWLNAISICVVVIIFFFSNFQHTPPARWATSPNLGEEWLPQSSAVSEAVPPIGCIPSCSPKLGELSRSD